MRGFPRRRRPRLAACFPSDPELDDSEARLRPGRRCYASGETEAQDVSAASDIADGERTDAVIRGPSPFNGVVM